MWVCLLLRVLFGLALKGNQRETKGKPKGNQRETKGKPKVNQRETKGKPTIVRVP